MSKLCLPVAFTRDQMDQFDALVVHRTKLKKNDTLYRDRRALSLRCTRSSSGH